MKEFLETEVSSDFNFEMQGNGNSICESFNFESILCLEELKD